MAFSFFSKMSERERRLGLITLAMVLVVVGITVVRHGISQIRALDEQIAARIDALANDRMQAQMAGRVEALYRQRAGRHAEVARSADIRTDMQNEILRLSLYRMPSVDDPNPSLQGSSLVSIPKIPEGDLDELGEGYREYSIGRLGINNVRIDRLAQFLQRIEDSPKLLRVDKLAIKRPNPETGSINATLRVTRTLLDALPPLETGAAETDDEPEAAEADPA